MSIKVGVISKKIINLLNLPYTREIPIFLGSTNIEHMKSSHAFEYEIYCDEIQNILANPDYVGLNKDNSIEYVKEFVSNDEFIKIAVRVTISGKAFARTLYALNKKRVQKFIKNGNLKKV